MRLDRLFWSPFHTRMVLGLGVAWILDGLEITVASSITGILICLSGSEFRLPDGERDLPN